MAAIEVCSRILTRNNEATIRWVPAHSGASGNEVADKYAKALATGGAPVDDIPEGYQKETSLSHMTRVPLRPDGGVNLEAHEARVAVQAPFRTRPSPAPAQTGEENPRRPLLPASVWSCGDRDPPVAV